MIRLNSYSYGCRKNYELKDTTTKDYIGRCCVIENVILGKGKCVNEIWNVRILEPFQRKGYATLMLKRIISKYKKEAEPLVLYVYKDNEIAIHLYEKMGFKIIGEYDNRRSDAWAMQYTKKGA